MKIRTKFLLYLTILILIIFTILYFVSLQISKNRIKESIMKHGNTAIKFKANAVTELLKTYSEFTEIVATGMHFVKYFDKDFDRKASENNIKARIETIKKHRKTVSSIRILNSDGIVKISSHDDVGMDISNKEIFIEGIKKTFISDIHFSTITEEYVITIATPISTNDKMSGVIVFDFNVEYQLFPVITDSTGLMYSTNIFLINKDKVLISPNKYNDKILETKNNPKQLQPCYDKHLQNETHEMDLTRYVSYVNYHGNKVMGTHIFIPNMKWFLIVEVNEADMQIPIVKYKYLISVLFFIVLIASIGVTFIISIYLTNPIKKLEKGAKKIINGNLDHKVAINSKDEIGQLSRVLDNMTEKLTISQRQLKDHSQLLEEQIKERTIELENKISESILQRQATLNIAADLEKTNVNLQTEISEHKLAENKLKERMTELEIFNDATVDREIKMLDLKREINELLAKLGKDEKYEIFK